MLNWKKRKRKWFYNLRRAECSSLALPNMVSSDDAVALCITNLCPALLLVNALAQWTSVVSGIKWVEVSGEVELSFHRCVVNVMQIRYAHGRFLNFFSLGCEWKYHFTKASIQSRWWAPVQRNKCREYFTSVNGKQLLPNNKISVFTRECALIRSIDVPWTLCK